MYALYTCIVIFTSILTGTNAHDKDAELAYYRTRRKRRQRRMDRTESGNELDSTIESDEAANGNSSLSRAKSNDSDVSDVAKQKSPKWKRVAKKAGNTAKKLARKAAHKAKQIVLTPTLILRSMLVDPFQDMDWAAVLSAYTIDIEEHHNFFVVTVLN